MRGRIQHGEGNRPIRPLSVDFFFGRAGGGSMRTSRRPDLAMGRQTRNGADAPGVRRADALSPTHGSLWQPRQHPHFIRIHREEPHDLCFGTSLGTPLLQCVKMIDEGGEAK